MKRRMNVVLVAILVMLCAIFWVVVRGQKVTLAVAASPADASAEARPIQTPTRSAALQSASDRAPAPTGQYPSSPPMLASFAEPAQSTPQASTERRVDLTPAVKAPTDTKAGYTAAQGDSLPNVVVGLLGSDTKSNRAAVIAANPSLKADPDRVLAGQVYDLEMPETSAPATQPAAPEVRRSTSDPILKYVAQPGDSVSVLAAGLLGSDSKTNRDAIISRNPSLQDDPDHVESGKTYKIPAANGLSSAPVSAAVHASSPTTQPDADGVIMSGAGRELRYTARTGDNVSKLAEVLLGSDTQANRDAIINNNASLKSDPDRVVAGQTYWIPAPAALVK